MSIRKSLAIGDVLDLFPEVAGKVSVRYSRWYWLFADSRYLGASTVQRDKETEPVILLFGTFFGGALALILTGLALPNVILGDIHIALIVAIAIWAIGLAFGCWDVKGGHFVILSRFTGPTEYGILLSPKLHLNVERRTYSLAYHLSRVLFKVQQIGPYKMAHERLGLPFPTFTLDSK